MPSQQEWLEHWPAIRQWWLVEGLTGNEVAEKLATRDFYVKGSQVDYRARKGGLRKRLPADTAASGNRTAQNSQSTVSEQSWGRYLSAASHQTNRGLNTLEQAQLGSIWAAGESDTSASEHVQVSAFSGPSSGATQRRDHQTANVTSYSSWTSQHDQEPLEDVNSRWMMSQDRPNSQRSPSHQSHRGPGASANKEAEGLCEPCGNQVGFFEFSYDNNGFTELGIDPLSLPFWGLINSYGESQFAYDTDAESGQEDIK